MGKILYYNITVGYFSANMLVDGSTMAKNKLAHSSEACF